MSEQIKFTAFLSDMFSGTLEKMRSKGTQAYAVIKASLGKISQESNRTALSIDQINKKLNDLERTRRVSVDLKQIRRADQEIIRLKKQRAEIDSTSGSGMGGMLASGGMVGAIIGAAYKAVSFISSSFKEWNDGAQSGAQVKASLISTKGVSGKQYGELESQAENLQTKTLFDDDATKRMQSVLLTFTKVRTEVFDQAVPLIQDMATKMGTDLNSAALQVGKALNEPIQGVNALRRAGVQLDDQQKKQIERYMQLGQVEKAQAIIIGELNTQFGGSAQAAAKAGTGGWTILNNKFKDFKEQIGEISSDGFPALTAGLGKVIDKAKEYITVPTSLHMQSEQYEVNALARTLMDSELPQNIRLENYNRLNQIAPDVVKNLSAENLNVQALAANLEKYNTQMKYKIAYQANEEKIAPHIKYQEDLASKLNKAEQNFVDKLQGFDTETSVRGLGARTYFDKILLNSKNFLYAAEKTAEFAGERGDEKFQNILTTKVNEMTKLKKLMAGSAGVVNDMWKNFNKYNPIQGDAETEEDKPGDNLDNGSTNNLTGDFAKAKNIYITIDNMVETFNVHSATINESSEQVREAISKALMTAVNDANRVSP